MPPLPIWSIVSMTGDSTRLNGEYTYLSRRVYPNRGLIHINRCSAETSGSHRSAFKLAPSLSAVLAQELGDLGPVVSCVQSGAVLVLSSSLHRIYIRASFDQHPHDFQRGPTRSTSQRRFSFVISALDISAVVQGQIN